MSLEAIQREVTEYAARVGGERIAQASKKADEIKSETLHIIDEEDRKSEEETQKIIGQIKTSVEASAKFEVKKLELNSKKDVIDKVFGKAMEKIQKLDEKTLERLTRILLKDAEKEILVHKIICNEKTKKWVPKSYKTEEEKMLGGLIAENSDGTLRVDNRFETILEDVRKESLPKIAKIIFSG